MPTILAIDDNRDNLVVVTALLSDAFPNARIVTALSGKEGIGKARIEHPDVILLDLVMPEMDGFETCSILKNDALLQRIPVIMLTAAKTDAASRIKALKLGAEAFLAKPIDEAELTVQVAAMLRIKRSEDTVRQENVRLEGLVKERTKDLARSASAALNLMEDLKAEIEERKEADYALIQSEERYRRITEGLSDYLYTVRVRGGRAVETIHSPACEVVTGYTKGEFDSNPYLWLEMVPKQEHRIITAQIKRILSQRQGLTGTLQPIEHHIIRKDGRTRWVRDTPILKFDSGGTLVSYDGVVKDITDSKLWEESLATERERLAVTLRSIADGVVTTDTEGNVVIVNRVAEELTGWLQKDAQGKPFTGIFNALNENDRKPAADLVKEVLASEETMAPADNMLLIARDGTERIIASSGAPIKDRNNAILGAVLVFRDVTEKQKTAESLRRADKLDSLGVLAGGIAHDFNNMLTGIFGYIELARMKVAADKSPTDYLDKALSVFNRAKDLTRQLLTFSKGGAPALRAGHLDLLIRESVAFALSGSPVTCEYRMAKDLWLCDFDKNHIGQVIDNLIINAQQAMPTGGKIVISAENTMVESKENPAVKGGKYVKVSVTDTGIGIEPDVIKRIFDPFFTTKRKGNGLGLATCYSIIHKHGGSIEVESEPGKGTTFHLFLRASAKETAEGASPAPSRHEGKGTLLIMDDEDSVREIVGMLLKEMGYAVVEAKEGKEALRLIDDAETKGHPFGGVFLDLTIRGGMGGKETVMEIRRKYRHLPVFASSGYSEDPVMSKPTEYGFTDSIAKPYRIAELAEMLNRHSRNQAGERR